MTLLLLRLLRPFSYIYTKLLGCIIGLHVPVRLCCQLSEWKDILATMTVQSREFKKAETFTRLNFWTTEPLCKMMSSRYLIFGADTGTDTDAHLPSCLRLYMFHNAMQGNEILLWPLLLLFYLKQDGLCWGGTVVKRFKLSPHSKKVTSSDPTGPSCVLFARSPCSSHSPKICRLGKLATPDCL